MAQVPAPPDTSTDPLPPGFVPASVLEEKKPRTWRSIAGIVLMIGALAALSGLFLLFPVDYNRLGNWGYLGVFGVVFVATASFILPIPYLLIVARAATHLNPWLVAGVSGLAGMLGEMTGYIVGISGSALVPHNNKWYQKSREWICTYGFWCIAFFSCVPNPFFDAIGAAAGVLRYAVWRFALACFLGKTIKFLIAALVGDQIRVHGWLD